MRLCLLTFQTALDFWSMTSYIPCLDWTPSGLLNCYCHNLFHAVWQNKDFVTTFQAEAEWNIEKALRRWSDRNRRWRELAGDGQRAAGFGSNLVEYGDGKCGLRRCKTLCFSGSVRELVAFGQSQTWNAVSEIIMLLFAGCWKHLMFWESARVVWPCVAF